MIVDGERCLMQTDLHDFMGSIRLRSMMKRRRRGRSCDDARGEVVVRGALGQGEEGIIGRS